jgi:AraC family transcriptional regulator, transcriptional activator for feuABC-ybbA operon
VGFNMKINNLFFHIHYCNGRHLNDPVKSLRKVTRKIGHHELIFVTAGRAGSIIIDNKNYPLKEGMLFYFCPDVLHTIDPGTGERAGFLSVHFSYAHVNFDDGKWAIRDEKDMLPLHNAQELKDTYLIEELFKKLVDTWNEKKPGYEFAARTLLQQLLIATVQNTRKQNRNFGASLKVEKAIQYMHQNSNKKVTLTELSDMVKLSPAYLSRSFKETTGYSVIEYFNKIKIDKAKELFIEGEKKVKEVSQLLGFSDEFYFSRIFKKIEGVSPIEYYSKNVHGV